MKFKFDANQPFQLEAISAVTDLFEGQALARGDFEVQIETTLDLLGQSVAQRELGFGNLLTLDDSVINQNLRAIQKRNSIFQEDSVSTKGLNFSVEMETGTGKTYVYLRTVFELNRKYGFKKFIIVVPSVAIREGVLKSMDMMKGHFRELYNQVPFNHFVYDSKRVSQLRGYARGNDLQLMVINIQAFDKKSIAIIHQDRDQMDGRRPIEFIQATRPIVILDEPQNMESRTAREAIASLSPLCTLRYSATHRDKYNLVYQLDPVRAFQKRLVKKISVASVLEEGDATRAYLKVEAVSNRNNRFTAKLKFFKARAEGPKLANATFKQHDDLFVKSGENEMYRNGFIITEINVRPGMEFVSFANGVRLSLGQEQGGDREGIVKKQIRETVRAHLDKERQVQGMGLKVLSLFFLDRVENYRKYPEGGGHEPGPYANWFEEIYSELAREYSDLFTEFPPVDKAHNGYFSKDAKGNFKDSSSGSSREDEDTYSLIMRNKEELLSLGNPLRFIFSHSALREGWDNPNVFQICTLNETVSALKKRQEIGRGLRLPVNQDGERVRDEYVNNLVVVANESYQDFVSTLQKEFEEAGVVFGRLPVEAFVGMRLVKDDQEKTLSTGDSETIWNHLKDSGWIADDGFILEEFGQAVENLTFSVPQEFKPLTREIAQAIEQHQIERHVAKHNPVKGRLNERVLLDPEFEKFWNAISTRTIYSVHYSTEELIEKAATAVRKMDKIEPPQIRTTFADVEVDGKGVSGKQVVSPKIEYAPPAKRVPDILSYIQGKVELTRSTLFQILERSGRIADFPKNPQKFMDSVVKEIRAVLHRMVIEGIQYERLDEISYEMRRFREEEHKLEFSGDRIVRTDKSVYDYITYDSTVEKKFAEGLEGLKNVKYFIKLPTWFRVPTPVGEYNPDWAILKQNGDIVYMIRETKSTKDQLKLRLPETDRIECGRKHFISIGVKYDIATSLEDAGL